MSKKSPKSKEPFTVGLAGGIGSGKSLVAKIFGVLDIPVFIADDAARELMDTDRALRQQLIELFGSRVEVGGELERAWIASQVFSNPKLLSALNGLVHPRVRDAFATFVKTHERSPYIIQEAAILFETGGYKLLDWNILVVAPEDLRLKRTMLRDKSTKEAIKNRMAAQWTDDQKKNLADYVIDNGEGQALIPQVLAIHQALMEQAN